MELILDFQIVLVFGCEENIVWFDVHVDNSESVNVDESIQDLGHNHPTLGLGQLKLSLGQGGKEIAALQVLGHDDRLFWRLIELNHLDDKLAILQFVEQPGLPHSVPALSLTQSLIFPSIKVSILSPPHEVDHSKATSAQLTDDGVVLQYLHK